MNPSDTQEQHSQFLEAMATQYSFTGDTRTVFLYRFDQANGGKDNTVLARSIDWSRKPEDGAQKLQDELKKICNVLGKKAGCPTNQPTSKGRKLKGESPWEQALKWLWETKYPEWQQRQNLGSINEYLALEIQPKPDETIFDEQEISFRDLYVPLKVRILDGNGNPIKDKDPIDLEEWAKETLNDNDKDKKILFIQADAGRGKSVFCRMFADWVRENWHPKSNLQSSFTPIVIRLRNLKVLENSLTKTFENYLETYDFVKNPSWLTDKNTRFLFFLDGFDELLLEGRASGGIKEFLQQVEHFQQSSHHRFIVTGRPLALQGIDRLITQTKSLERFEIQLMDDSIRQTWLEKWAVKVGQEEANEFRQFLDSCPTDIKDNLAREPLLLYLLARMHKEQHLNVQMFAEAEGIRAKVRIYDKSVSWVLEKQRQDQNMRLTGFDDKDDLRSCLTEAALCVVQSGNESAKVTMLVSRLKSINNPLAEAIEQARIEIKDEEKFFNNLLTSFYIKPASGDKEGSVEFCHKSFSEFLFAERLKESILDWTTTKPTRRQREREEYLTSTNEMNRQIYDLLGYGGLTREIVDYLMALLAEDEAFKPIKLFERLENFYECWCDGEFIDVVIENLVQLKMQALKTQIPERETQLGLRQVDIYTGLNVMILLLELHCCAQNNDELKGKIVFYLCGQKDNDNFQSERLLRIISYSNSVNLNTFLKTVNSYLSSAKLEGAKLEGANLIRANLEGAKLEGAKLTRANLIRANLEGANLKGANLEGANLEGANLEGANLRGANLRGANLQSASLRGAKLEDANLVRANLVRANLEGANLEGANLEGANVVRANLVSAILVRAILEGTILEEASLRGANLIRANLRGANLESAKLIRANLESANLESASLRGANLIRANLIRAKLIRANLIRAKLIRTNLSGANLVSAILVRANFSSAILEGGILEGANLSSAILSSANLSNANLSNANLIRAILLGAKLSGASLIRAILIGEKGEIIWDKSTNWKGVRGLETAQVPESLKQQLGL
ncbi:pentapeptide repeat-containing protein [Aetokthonos hydrillicola Thurmond2011]|uniref:Pentapeptide repeat-containing protein n=1 Tax=Aetokthonos hydrillicola Thurmond2011 TaxID=2712845 RepID=A0AAP5IFC2_9CYAN|nr:pentapeptide repeat-containing protein [Aetokthonos hydrillicola]MBO3461232.1 low-complexity protein [Aetokthonos hydrillicola CCALA 1050]MBW4591039.1 pentapeptide repeat-containing protein [Aetokthonos hydrillicola CCALA 1050]MDR9900209.1 pentapeptide repeat-containing protein [Aetokthonos hydrillicola Thurmond2011]